jgi:hypothetical protein
MESIHAYESLITYRDNGKRNVSAEDGFHYQRDYKSDREMRLTILTYDTGRELSGLVGITYLRKD